MTPIEDLLTPSQRLSFDGTEYRCNFFRRMAEKIFWGNGKKNAQTSDLFGDLRLWWRFSVFGRLNYYVPGRCHPHTLNPFFKRFYCGGWCLSDFEQGGEFCARVSSDLRQMVFFRL